MDFNGRTDGLASCSCPAVAVLRSGTDRCSLVSRRVLCNVLGGARSDDVRESIATCVRVYIRYRAEVRVHARAATLEGRPGKQPGKTYGISVRGRAGGESDGRPHAGFIARRLGSASRSPCGRGSRSCRKSGRRSWRGSSAPCRRARTRSSRRIWKGGEARAGSAAGGGEARAKKKRADEGTE